MEDDHKAAARRELPRATAQAASAEAVFFTVLLVLTAAIGAIVAHLLWLGVVAGVLLLGLIAQTVGRLRVK